MASDVSRENEDFIEQEIAAGRFRDRQEALNAGIGLLRQQRALTDRLAHSRRQLDQGEYVEFDSDSLRGLFNDLKQRVRGEVSGPHVE